MIVSIDPGESNGYAVWDNRGMLLDFGTVKGQVDFFKWLDSIKDVSVYVIEEFHLFPGKAKEQYWSSFVTVENIGAVRLMAYKRGSHFIGQRPDIKTIAYKLSGIQQQRSHANSHKYDALVHGYFYFTKLGLFTKPFDIEQRRFLNAAEG